MRVMRVTVAIGMMLAVAAPAAADGITMFPLSAGKLPTALAKAPAKMTAAVAKAIDAEVANVPIEDAAGLLDCDPEATACIEAVSRSVKAKRIVFGSITADADGVIKVTLTRFDPGPDRQQRTFELTSTTADGMAEELARVSAPLFGKVARTEVTDRLDPKDPKDPNEANQPRESRDDAPRADTQHGAISGTTYGILGGGALVTGIGIIFLVQASGIANDVRSAPHNTPDDFRKLTALEDTGRTRQRLGIGFTAVGGIAVAYGIYRALTERSARVHESSAMVTPVPIEGGAVVVFTMGMP